MNNILRYKNYKASVHFSVADDVFYGDVLGINDFVSFESVSEEGIKISFQEAVEDYLETCTIIGKSPHCSQ